MKRSECMPVLAPLITPNIIMVVGMTGTRWEWERVSQHPGTLYGGGMAAPTALGLGLALSLPHRKIIVLDSDGSTLLGLSTLPTVGCYAPDNLKVFVFDNEAYSGSRISVPTATAECVDLEAIAKGCGIASSATVRDLGRFEQHARAAVDEPGLSFTVVKVEEEISSRGLPPTTEDHLEGKYRFMRYIERTEGKKFFSAVR